MEAGPKPRGVFLSYRRATSWAFAQLICDNLERRGYDVFMDVTHLDHGDFQERVLREIQERASVVVVLQRGTTFETVPGEIDWMRIEIAHALALGRKIVPVMADGFRFPLDGSLPPDIARLATINGVPIYSEYFDAGMQRLDERFLVPRTNAASPEPSSIRRRPVQRSSDQGLSADTGPASTPRATSVPEGVELLARLGTSAFDARRGIARLHPEVIGALGLEYWDAVRVTGARSTVALAGPAPQPSAPGTAILDETAMINAGVVDGSTVGISAAPVAVARSVELAGSRLAVKALPPETLRAALIGKVLLPGDTLSLLPQDVAPIPGADAAGARRELAAALGGTWTTELVTVTAAKPAPDADPFSALVVAPTTTVRWRDGASTSGPGRYP